ncbi:hypothetical protein [Myroides injenensis]|uniref:hypothetical protein n=1 Tax=Myroides injenensis TaxID=1183151 RepID=UPI000289366C|nr:hypothetical protein [Myroides injenensis]
MKALFRLIVLCFFLLAVGLAYANQAVEVSPNAMMLKQQVFSNTSVQKNNSNVYFQSEVELEIITHCNNGDFEPSSFDYQSIIDFIVSNMTYRLTDKQFIDTHDVFAFLQQHRAKYLLYHSYKIPNTIVG